MTQPKAIAIIQQYFDSGSFAVAKNKAMSVEWVNVKLATTNGCIAINAFPEVNRLAGDKYTMLLRYVDHRSSLKEGA